MSGNQLPVLSLDFSDEKIKVLQDIADKFRAGFAVGPGGFPVTPPKPIPGSNNKPALSPGSGAGTAAFDKFMQSLKKDADGTLKTFTLINKTLQITTSTLKDLFTTTISWGTKIAALAVGGPFGYDMMSRHVGAQLMNAQGLNMTFGQTQAASSVYGSRFSSTSAVEQMLATAQANPNSQEYKEALALGLDPKLGVAGNLPKFYDKINQLHRQYGGNTLAALHGMGVSQIGTEDLNQITANRGMLPLLQQQYFERSKSLDSDINAGVMRGYQGVSSNLTNNGQEIYDTFLTAVSKLNPAITSLSDTITSDIKGFLGGPNGKQLFSDIATGLTELSHWLKSQEFQKDLTEFEKAVKEVAGAVGSVAKWIFGITGHDDTSNTDSSGGITFDSKFDAMKALNSDDPQKKKAARDYLNSHSYFLKNDPLTSSISDSQNDSEGDEVRQWPSWANWMHGGRQGKPLNQTRGIRNNNPGNLNFAGQRGASLEDGPEGRFAVFPTMIAGISALDKQLGLYLSRGKNTIDSIVRTYAPAADNNNVAAYDKYLAGVMHLGVNEKIDPTSGSQMLSLIRGIIGMENGDKGNLISNSDILAAMAMNRGQAMPPGSGRQNSVRIEVVQTPGADYTGQVIGINQIPH